MPVCRVSNRLSYCAVMAVRELPSRCKSNVAFPNGLLIGDYGGFELNDFIFSVLIVGSIFWSTLMPNYMKLNACVSLLISICMSLRYFYQLLKSIMIRSCLCSRFDFSCWRFEESVFVLTASSKMISARSPSTNLLHLLLNFFSTSCTWTFTSFTQSA